MPQKKKTHKFIGIHKVLNYYPDIRSFADKHPGLFKDEQEFEVLVKAAVAPIYLSRFGLDGNVLESFIKMYSKRPDDVLEFMLLVRRILKKWKQTQAGKVIQALSSHHIIPTESRSVECDKDGNRMYVIVKSKITGKEERIPINGLDDSEVNGILMMGFRFTASLQDKEIATLLNVNPESVKKARQELNRIDREIAYREQPAVIQFLKTGVETPEYLKLAAAHAKGK